MAIQDLLFLAAIGSGYLTFMLTLGWAAWYCRGGRRLAPAVRPGRPDQDA